MLAYVPEDEAWELEAENAALALYTPSPIDAYSVIYGVYMASVGDHVVPEISRHTSAKLFLVRLIHRGNATAFGKTWSVDNMHMIAMDDDLRAACFRRQLARMSYEELRATRAGFATLKVDALRQIDDLRQYATSNAVIASRAWCENSARGTDAATLAIALEFDRRRQLQAERTSLAQSGLIDHLAVRDRDAAHYLSRFTSAYITSAQPLVIHTHREQ